MQNHSPKTSRKSERGVALFIAIFALLLISVVALALMVMAGTETSLNSNYKSSVQAFYDARAGVEEARGRLWSANPNYIGALLISPVLGYMPVGQVAYIRNPAGAEVVDPTDMSTTNPYADRKYASEWGGNPPGTATMIASVSTQAGVPGPLYKWVRITPRTEASAGIDVDGDGNLDTTNPLFYDGKQQGTQAALLAAGGTPFQVFEFTALAVTPSGSQRMVQYVAAATNLNLQFPSALTFDGLTPNYNAPSSNPFDMNGNDRSGSNPMAGCTIPVQAAKPAVGVTNPGDIPVAESTIPANRLNHYLGSGGTPSVGDISSLLPPTEQTPANLNDVVSKITQVANNVITGPANSLTAAQLGTASNPQITVVNGDLTLTGNNTGYGILVVTGQLTFSGNTGWRGIVLVVGQGSMLENGGGNNEFDGAVLVAKTLDASGNQLTTLGQPILDWNGGGGNGVYYDSCWINSATSGLTYKVLGFREISQ
jgi:hypothetical protein